MRRYSRLAAAATLATGIFAQDQVPVFRSDTRLVVLHATVADKSGKLLPNLAQDAFKVFENGVEQPIKLFRREDVPVSLGIVIDNSGSMRMKRQKVEAAALQFVKASNRSDEVFIVNFNDEAFLDQDFTNDIKLLQAGLAKIDSRGGTAMRDALRMSIDHVKEGGKKDKKVLLAVTDGDDNNSQVTLEALVRAAQQSEVLIYTVGILGEEERRDARRAQRALQSIASATGGASYFPKNLEEVDSIAERIAHDIRNQYVLAYSPINQSLDGSYRTIKVVANGPGKPVVRTRPGYYATPDGVKRAGAVRPSN